MITVHLQFVPVICSNHISLSFVLSYFSLSSLRIDSPLDLGSPLGTLLCTPDSAPNTASPHLSSMAGMQDESSPRPEGLTDHSLLICNDKKLK